MNERTWTFFGHWDNDEIVIEYYQDGEVEDQREDTGYWEQGLWAASARGFTVEEAEQRVLAEYMPDDEDEGCGPSPQHEEAALRVFGAMHGYTR